MPRRLWIGGIVQAPLYITEPQPFRPDLVVWLDIESGKIVSSEVTEPPASMATLVASLLKALGEGTVKRPDRIRVADTAMADAIRPVLSAAIALEIAPTPELTLVVEDMSEFLDTSARAPGARGVKSYFEDGRVSPSTVARLFETAADLYDAQPWNILWDADALGLDVSAYGLSGTVLSVIGRAGEHFGFVLFESASDYDSFGAALSNRLAPRQDLGAATLSLNFDVKSRVPAQMIREIAAHGWTVAGPNAYPHIMAIDRDRIHRPLRERDVAVVCAAAECLTRFIAQHGAELSPEMQQPIVEEYSIGNGESLVVRLTAPHPEMPWLPNFDEPKEDEQPQDDDFDDEDSDIDAEDRATELELNGSAVAFVEHARLAGRPPLWLEAAGSLADSVVRFKLAYAGGTMNNFTEWDAEAFLLDHFPRKVAADDELIDQAPEALMAFCDWLADRGTIPSRVAAAVRKRIPAVRKRFVAAARDPSRYDPGKQLFMELRANGIEPSDEAAVHEYMLRYNNQLAGGAGSRGRMQDDDSHRGARLKLSPRWVPAPGATRPEKKQSCPCGSGRVYGKCCMPR